MKKILFLFSLLLLGGAIFAQTGDTGFHDALLALGVTPTVVTLVLGIGAILLGQFALPQKWTSILLLLEVGIHWINENTNRLSEKQKQVKAAFDNELKSMKKKGIVIPTILLLLIFSIGANAQSKFTGFFGPINKAVKDRQVSLKAEGASTVTSVFLFRPSASLTAVLIEFNSPTPLSHSLSAIGFGVSYGKYTLDASGNSYCNYAVNGSLWTSMLIGENVGSKMGLSVTGEILNRLIGLGPILYLDAGKPKLGLAVNLSYRF
jgi:hypothetical protein